MSEKRIGQVIYSDGRKFVVLGADEVVVDEIVHADDGAAVHHVISFSRAAWHEVMSGSEREFRQETER